MNLGLAEACALARDLKRRVASIYAGPETAVCPSHPHLIPVRDVLEGSVVALGGQDLTPQSPGAFTGAVSAEQLRELAARFVLIGHSERRQFFGETDAMVAEKIRAAFRVGLVPVLCFGETLEERNAGRTEEVVARQVTAALEGLEEPRLVAMVLAYEPVWAIGTGHNAEVEDAANVHRLVRGLLREIGGESVAGTVRILYGGSVKPANVAGYLEEEDIDGALVGGASLDAEKFVQILCYQNGES
jgi:triosephosphate isomerase